MKRVETGEATVRLLTRLYAALLLVYPSTFRVEYKQQMVQVFRTACRDLAQRDAVELARFVLHALGDLATSGPAERFAAVREQRVIGQAYAYVAALLLSFVTGYIHLHSDADRLSILLVFGAAFMCALLRPGGAWRYGLILGLGIPIAVFVGHGGTIPFGRGDTDMPLPLPLIPGLIGAQMGVLLSRIVPYFMILMGSGNQRST